MEYKNIIGALECYTVGDDFSLYVNRLEHVFLLNNITECKAKISFLISLGGAELYKILHSLIAPRTENDFIYLQIIHLLKEHFTPKRNIIAECFKFNKRDQKQNEPIAEYIIELKTLAQTCDFREFLDRALLIRFVCGLHSETIQTRLLSESNLDSFRKATDIALAMEMTSENVKSMRGAECFAVSSYNDEHRGRRRTMMQGRGASKKKEIALGESQNSNRKFVICFHCKKRGHYMRECWHLNNNIAESSSKRNKNNYVNQLIKPKVERVTKMSATI
ncbi:uncharacterized protein LOC142224544 [Haematobia irritans]|uniref:uncharacterized protein LOC142224544 n=1 Tax=Haematobia irritans TaxID=7368 RepID=UPI003F4F6609